MHSIEAAVIIPIILFLFCGILRLGFELHDVVKEAADLSEHWEISVMAELRQIDRVQMEEEIFYED
ncbi:MAG: hypothetical protein ACI4DO_05345 [Roseburia sp.]